MLGSGLDVFGRREKVLWVELLLHLLELGVVVTPHAVLVVVRVRVVVRARLGQRARALARRLIVAELTVHPDARGLQRQLEVGAPLARLVEPGREGAYKCTGEGGEVGLYIANFGEGDQHC